MRLGYVYGVRWAAATGLDTPGLACTYCELHGVTCRVHVSIKRRNLNLLYRCYDLPTRRPLESDSYRWYQRRADRDGRVVARRVVLYATQSRPILRRLVARLYLSSKRSLDRLLRVHRRAVPE